MAIQYPKLEHVTLPSVEGFNGTINILRDPPKSIFTKRNDKVGQTMGIISDIDDSGDRMNEAIKVYARGVNPMVSVSYDNNSNNAGSFTRAGSYGQGNNISQGHHQGTRQAFLPYRIADKGAFRPPIRSPFDLLPLSRQPRVWFEALTKPGFVDYSKQKFLPSQFRMIKDMILKTKDTIKPNSSVKIERPIQENYKMQNAINAKHINIEGLSGKRTLDHSNFTRENVDLYKGIQENYEQVNATTNKRSNRSHNLSNMKIDEGQYIQDRTYYESNVNPSQHRSQGMEGLAIDKDAYVQDRTYYESNANPSQHRSQGLDGLAIDEDAYVQDRTYYESNANPSQHRSQGLDGLAIDKDAYVQDRTYYESNANPSQYRSQGLEGLAIDKDRYINDKEYHDFIVNKGRDINTKTLDELNGNTRTSVKDVMQYQTESGKNTGYTLLTEMPDMELEHHMPRYTMASAVNDPTVHRRVEHQNTIQLRENIPRVSTVRNVAKIEDMNNFDYASSREYKLPETLQKGSFLNAGAAPTMDRSQIQFRQDPNKERIKKYLNDTQFGRFNH